LGRGEEGRRGGGGDGGGMEGMFILQPARPTSAIKYLQSLYSTKKKSTPPQLYSTIYRIYFLNYSTNYSPIFLVLWPGDIFKNSEHQRIDSQPTKIAGTESRIGKTGE
jgi:hypothetical protein